MTQRAILAAVLALAVLGHSAVGADAKPAKPIVYPVKITIKIKPAVLPPDSPWRELEGVVPIIALFGRVTSPKPACEHKRPIIGVNKPRGATKPYEDKRTGIVSDSTGYWEGEAVPDLSLTKSVRSGEERIWAKVARKPLGKRRFCAEAISARLKAP